MHEAIHVSKRWVMRHVRRIRPAHPWMYYTVAIALIAGVLAANLTMNTAIIRQSAMMTQALDSTADRMVAEMQHMVVSNRQRAIMGLSLLALLVVGLLIFLPVQGMVRASLTDLQARTKAIQQSRRQLATINKQLNDALNHDALTGLPNRSAILRDLADLCRSNPGADIGVLFVGLDQFKSTNDTVGHETGDAILCAVANLFASCIDTEDLIARVGGDEFVLATLEPPRTLANRLMLSLGEPITLAGRKHQVRASIGLLSSRCTENNALALIANAGIALQAAKNAGGHRIQEFTSALRDQVDMALKLKQELPDAIATGQIEPWFQPQISLKDCKLHGAEVLARWRHPVHGILSPDKFMPAAMQVGLMPALDHAVWKRAMKLMEHWQDIGIDIPHISLNAAPETISDPDLIERFLLMLNQSGLCPDQIVIEVLETTIINGADDMASLNIDSLAECGISLELDDFGTGYASLARLTHMPLAGIKLDRSLVADLPNRATDSVIRAILTLAVDLGLKVIAEGIEGTEQANSLTAHGCAVGQGYGFARPMSADNFLVWMRNNPVLAPTAGPDRFAMSKRA